MNNNYKHYFGFNKEPFPQDINIKEIYLRNSLTGLEKRFNYSLSLLCVNVITGDIGSGKSTGLRYVTSKLHPSKYKIIFVIANTGSIGEILRLICQGLNIDNHSSSMTRLNGIIKNQLIEIANIKQTPILIIDEAHLLRLEVFSEIHTLLQFEFDSKPLLPLILCGQTSLVDKLRYHSSRSLSSRVVGKTHLDGLKLKEMEEYLKHHLEIAGINEQLFTEDAVLAIHQGSGGLLRTANVLARGSLISAAENNKKNVTSEDVRIASTEIII